MKYKKFRRIKSMRKIADSQPLYKIKRVGTKKQKQLQSKVKLEQFWFISNN